MAGAFDSRLDCFFFVHGILLALVAVCTLGLARRERSWRWLAWFAGAQAIGAWLSLVAIDAGDTRLFLSVRHGFLLGAFVLLLEFGREHLVSKMPRLAGRGAQITAGLLVIIAFFPHGWGQLFSAETALVIIGGAAAAAGLFLAGKPLADADDSSRSRSNQIGSAIAAYTLLTAFSLSIGGVSGGTGGISLVAILSLQSGLGAYLLFLLTSEKNAHCTDAEREKTSRPFILLIRYGGVAAILCLSWIAAENASSRRDAALRDEVMMRAKLFAAAVPIDDVRPLHWSDEDLTSPSYQRLKQLMQALVRANPDLRFALLIGLREEHAYFLVDSEAPASPDYSPPGQFYAEADPAYLQGLDDRRAYVLGPVTDHWGTWIIASVPLLDLGPGKGCVAAELDITANHWGLRLRGARLPIWSIALVLFGALITFLEIRERTAERAAQLDFAERRWLTLNESWPSCIQWFDTSGRCVSVNRRGLEAFGLPAGGVIGLRFPELWSLAERPALEDALKQAARGEPWTGEVEYLRPDGRSTPWRITLAPARDAREHVLGFVALCSDVSERQQDERTLAAARLATDHANTARRELLASLHKEMRPALSAVLETLDATRTEFQSTETRNRMSLAREKIAIATAWLDDHFDLVQLEAGELPLHFSPFKLRATIAAVMEERRAQAEARGVALSWAVTPAVPEVLVGDAARLKQVLAHLIGNALKFTPKGFVRTAIDCDALDLGSTRLRVSVQDNGLGLTSEIQQTLHGKLDPLDPKQAAVSPGIASGLVLIKNLIDRMGGTLAFESEPGRGAKFTFTAWFALGRAEDLASQTTSATDDPPTPASSLRLLCAEDDATNRLIVESFSRRLGHTVDFAVDGQRALELLSTREYDAVLMDNRMPIVDGLHAARIIRNASSSVLDHAIYIVALTAATSPAYRQEFFDAGMNAVLVKPLQEADLREVLSQVSEYKQKRAAEVSAASTPSAASPAGLSEAELLAILDEDRARPAPIDPLAGLSAEAKQVVVQQSLVDVPARLAEMRVARPIGDQATFGRGAHSIKNLALYLRAPRLSELAREIETLTDAGKSDAAFAQLETLEEEFAKAKLDLRTPTAVLS